MLQIPYLQAILACHIVRGRIPFEAGVKVYLHGFKPFTLDERQQDACHLQALYSGRTLKAIDGTVLMVTFLQWPRGGPCINEVPGGHMAPRLLTLDSSVLAAFRGHLLLQWHHPQHSGCSHARAGPKCEAFPFPRRHGAIKGGDAGQDDLAPKVHWAGTRKFMPQICHRLCPFKRCHL